MIASTNATMEQAVIALGSNLGSAAASPITQLQVAALKIAALSAGPVLASSIWQSAPVGFEEQVPDFANAVMLIESSVKPELLLQSLQRIEQDMGRERAGEDGYQSRTIDLDVIDLAGRVHQSGRLTLPHPRAHQRLFVLVPLQEVMPAFRFPGRAESLEVLIERASPVPMKKLTRLIP